MLVLVKKKWKQTKHSTQEPNACKESRKGKSLKKAEISEEILKDQ